MLLCAFVVITPMRTVIVLCVHFSIRATTRQIGHTISCRGMLEDRTLVSQRSVCRVVARIEWTQVCMTGGPHYPKLKN